MHYKRIIFCIISFLLPSMMLHAQITFQSLHVEKGIIKGYYELSSCGLCYDRKGHTISINGKTYPFYMRIEDNSTIRKWENPSDSVGWKEFINMDFALDAQREIYKRDLYLSPFEYGYDGTLVHSAGALYYSKRNRRKIVACYYFSGDVILYKINRFCTKKDDEKLSFILKKMLSEREFVILKEANSVSHLSKKDISLMGLEPTAIYSFFYCLDE